MIPMPGQNILSPRHAACIVAALVAMTLVLTQPTFAAVPGSRSPALSPQLSVGDSWSYRSDYIPPGYTYYDYRSSQEVKEVITVNYGGSQVQVYNISTSSSLYSIYTSGQYTSVINQSAVGYRYSTVDGLATIFSYQDSVSTVTSGDTQTWTHTYTTTVYNTPYSAYDYPIEPGKNWTAYMDIVTDSVTYTSSSPDPYYSSTPYTAIYHFSCTGRDVVEVDAGTYDCLVIEFYSDDSSAHSISWYSPAVGSDVKTESYYDGALSGRNVLTSTSYKAPPQAVSDTASVTTKEDTPAELDMARYFTGDIASYTCEGSIHISAVVDGSTVWLTPDENWYGNETVTVTASDDRGRTASVDIHVNVTPVDDPPVKVGGSQIDLETLEDTPAVLDLASIVDDIDTSPALLDWSVSGDDGVNTSVNGSTLTLSPWQDWNGVWSGDLRCENLTWDISLTVMAVNDPLHVDFHPSNTSINSSGSVVLNISYYDPDGAPPIIEWTVNGADMGNGICLRVGDDGLGRYEVSVLVVDSGDTSLSFNHHWTVVILGESNTTGNGTDNESASSGTGGDNSTSDSGGTSSTGSGDGTADSTGTPISEGTDGNVAGESSSGGDEDHNTSDSPGFTALSLLIALFLTAVVMRNDGKKD